MSKAFGIGFGAAALVIVIVIWIGFARTKGNHLAPTGWISSVRVQPLTDEETMMVVDFGLLNDADVQMVVAKVDPWITTRDGQDVHGSLFAGAEMDQTFAFYKQLGPRINPPLPPRAVIEGHHTVNRMVAIEFDVPARVVLARKSVTVHIEDITGPFVELTAK